MIFKSFFYWIWFVVLALLAAVLANIPLFNLLAFEFCAVLAIGISFAGAHVAVMEVQRLRARAQSAKGSPAQIVNMLFWRAFGGNLALLIAPLIIILLNAFRVKNCDFSEGFTFFLLLPVVSCAYATAAGAFFGLWLKRRWTAYLAYLAYIFATLLLLAYNLIFHPPVFGYHATFGYFPGPIYDERIAISGTLLIARGTTLLLAWMFLSLAINTLVVERRTPLPLTLDWRKLYRFKPRYDDLNHRIRLVVLVAIFALIYLFRGDLGLRPTRDYIEHRLGGLEETEHFKIYYEKGSRVEREIEWIARDHEFRYAQLIRYFEMQPTRKVQSYIYTSPEQKKRLIGARGTSIEDPLGYGFHINYEDFPHPVMKHELAHALTADWHPILKVSLKLGLHEGIAVAADWEEGKLTAHQWSKAMRQLGLAPTMRQIMGLGFWAQSSSRSYTLAGSFVRFLVHTDGIEKFRRVFPTGNFDTVYDKSLANLAQEWEAFLEEIPLTAVDLTIAEHRFKRPSIFQKPCAHEVAALSAKAWAAYRRSHFSMANRLFEQIYAFDPRNPRNLRGLMFGHYQMGNYPSTLEWGAEIIADPKASVRQVAEAKNVEGDVYWQQGNRAEAQSRYQGVFALHASDSLDREVQAKLATLGLDFTDVEDKIKRVLIDQSSRRLKMTLLHEVINELPTWGLGYYLIGRQLYFDQEYAASNRYLLKAAALGLPHRNLDLENMRLIGVNAYRLGHYDQALEQFQRIAALDTLPLGVIYSAEDWIERCEWEISQLGR
ncbi:MAG: hypothetical protein O7E52_12935 [Candidatus Poribacteria bacterium]|nr:hypothetical protein [Candidatus Poribacteria bacterium]